MPSVKTILQKKTLSNNRFPVYLRITHNRRSKFFKTIFDAALNEWQKKSGRFSKRNPNYIQNNRVLGKFEDRALKIIGDFELEGKDYTLNEIENKFRIISNPLSKNVFLFWDEIINEMILSGKIGNADVNRSTYKSVKQFNRNSSSLNFDDINLTFLRKYEVFLRSRGGTDGGIGVKMRAIRAIFNRAIERNIAKESHYPFKAYKLSKLKGKGNKRALNIEEIQKIINFDIEEHPQLRNSRNYFVFSFLTRGMNFVDMMKLTWKDISNDQIFYTRSKTQGNFIVKILPPVEEILTYYKDNKSMTKYVFPILLKDNLTPLQIGYRKQKTLSKFNKDMKQIAEICEILKPISSYVARHSFANCLKQKGIGTDIISESMGHQDVNTTKAYLKELDSSVIDDACELLLDF